MKNFLQTVKLFFKSFSAIPSFYFSLQPTKQPGAAEEVRIIYVLPFRSTDFEKESIPANFAGGKMATGQ